MIKKTVSLLLALMIWPVYSYLAEEQTFTAHSNPEKQKKVAIVIDDFGNSMSGTEEMMNLSIPITVAVMPFLPTSKKDAEWAHRLGHEVLVHLPMEPLNGRKSWLGPGAVTTQMTDDEIRTKVRQAVDDIPFAVGINNHMGSKATADPRVMSAVLEVCKERGLFFLDSKTNYRSVVTDIGAQLGIQVIENQIFLDDHASEQHISKQLKRVNKCLENNSRCIAIGHVGRPGINTAQAIRKAIPFISEKAEFVTISKLIKGNSREIKPY